MESSLTMSLSTIILNRAVRIRSHALSRTVLPDRQSTAPLFDVLWLGRLGKMKG
ncbi:MAG: hypothetical protein ACYSSI_13900 [Planctomycetota bacterium]|jgi:hypothetical protein